jgi:hypothetical protein
MITAPPRLFLLRRKEGWVLTPFDGRSLRFSHREKSDGCPTAKLPSDASVAFASISVGTEMKRKSYNRVFGMFARHKALHSPQKIT